MFSGEKVARLCLCGERTIYCKEAHGLIGSGFVGDNAVVKEVTDDAKVQDTLRCVNVGYVGYPLLIGPLGGEAAVP